MSGAFMINSLFSQTFQVDVSVAVEDRESISMLNHMSALLGLRRGRQDIKGIFFQSAGPHSRCLPDCSIMISGIGHDGSHLSIVKTTHGSTGCFGSIPSRRMGLLRIAGLERRPARLLTWFEKAVLASRW